PMRWCPSTNPMSWWRRSGRTAASRGSRSTPASATTRGTGRTKTAICSTGCWRSGSAIALRPTAHGTAEEHGEHRAAAGTIGGFERAAVRFGQGSGDRQAEAGSDLPLAAAREVGAVEPLEDALLGAGWQAWAVVAHLKEERFARGGGGNRDFSGTCGGRHRAGRLGGLGALRGLPMPGRRGRLGRLGL